MSTAVNLAPGLPDGLWIKHPVLMASGTFGYGTEYDGLVDLSSIGGIVSKAVAAEPRLGNVTPRVFETPAGMLNSIGLQGIGVEAVIRKKAPIWENIGVPVIVNVVGESVDDFCVVAERLEGVPGVAGIELNVSCPNVEGGMLFGSEPGSAARLTAAVRRRFSQPIMVKLTPNTNDIVAVALAVEDAGADSICVANTFIGMSIDIKKRRPVFAAGSAGLSGPAIRPMALRLVYEVAKFVTVPVVGCGGIATTDDALEFFLAGATAIQVGTMTFTEPRTAERIAAGVQKYLDANHLGSIAELTGAANPEFAGRSQTVAR